MNTVVVSAEWLVSGPATESDQSLLADALSGGDPCVWVEDERPGVLVATIEVEASDIEAALRQGREVFLTAASVAGLSGSLLRMSASDEGGFVRWP